MIRLQLSNRKCAHATRGFTLLELLLVMGILALLALVALPIYRHHAARSQASELALKYDAVRTAIQVVTRTGEVQAACNSMADAVQTANLQSRYAQLSVNFEPVVGGYTPVLTMCASAAAQGVHAVDVTREAHHLLSRNSVVSQGAVLGDSAVSFSVRLAGEAPQCKVLPPVASGQSPCSIAGGHASVTTGTLLPPLAKPPATTASVPTGAVSGPVSQATAGAASCTRLPLRTVQRQAMRFSGDGRVASGSGLDTGGALTGFSAEVVIAGDQKNDPTGTLISYATDQAFRGFSLWGTQSLHVGVGSMHYDTKVNVEDGQPHRLTMSWQQSGTAILYDNGREVWRRDGINSGGTLGANGRLTIGQADESSIWGSPTFKDPYSGLIVNAAFSNRVISATQVASGPLHSVYQPSSGLLADVVVGADGKPMDTAGRGVYGVAGNVGGQSVMIDTALYAPADCR